MPFTQENRLMALKITGLGDDDLLLTGFSGNEAISRLFTFYLDTMSPNGPIDFSKVLGKMALITVKQSNGESRYFNGFVIRFVQSGADQEFTYYQLEVAPYLWKATLQADCRIFHNKRVDEILTTIFNEVGLIKHLRMSLSTTYQPMEYCVQYRETDFNFVSRLMEQNGIFYYFEHATDGHTLVVGDANSAFAACPGQPTADYNSAPSGGAQSDDVISSWTIEQVVKTGKYSLTDYNFETPSTSLAASEPTIVDGATQSNLEIFDYPGDYPNLTQGKSFARLRMQEEEAGHNVIRASSLCRAFTTGQTFSLTSQFQESMDGDYLLTEIQHIATAGSYTDTNGSDGDSYSNTFACIPNSVPFRPARLTPKPFVQGPQTAVVVGKKDDPVTVDGGGGDGEEIWVDKYGRVTVRFFWDRKKDCSCRVRVSQEWAGQGWGSMHIPRVGQEVVVSFLEGDPDRPLVTGRVYNAEQTVPWILPDNQTQSGIKTRSTPKGGTENYNEIRFEDKKGSEDLLIHAERTMHNSVETTQTITTGVDRNITVGGMDEYGNKIGTVHEKIFLDSNLHVLNDQKIKIEGERSLHVLKDQKYKIEGNSSFHVVKSQYTEIEESESLHIKINQLVSVEGNISTNVEGGGRYKYGKDLMHAAQNTVLIIGDKIQLQADTEIVLMAGSSSITINASGVSITGSPLINLNSPGAPPTQISPLSTVAPTDPVDPIDPIDPP